LTLTVAVIGVPGQVLAIGVIVYVAVAAVVVPFVSDWDMAVPLPARAPVIPGAVTVQLKLVPLTFDVKLIVARLPLQIAC
jgi:hypothetical protein